MANVFSQGKGYEEHFYTAGSIILDFRSQTKLIYGMHFNRRKKAVSFR